VNHFVADLASWFVSGPAVRWSVLCGLFAAVLIGCTIGPPKQWDYAQAGAR